MESTESDHNRVPGSSAPNKRSRESTKATPRTANLHWLVADPNLWHQVAGATSAVLSPTPSGTCIRAIPTAIADGALSISAELTPRSKRPWSSWLATRL